MPGTEWYYALKGKKLGPISAEDLENLALSGDLQPETLVWSEGMAEWQRHDAVFPDLWKTLDRAGSLGGPSGVPATARIPPVHPGLQCARCRRPLPVDDLVPIASQRICLQCKSVVLQGLQEKPEGDAPVLVPELEAIRREHVAQEASLKSMGILCMLNAIFATFFLLGTMPGVTGTFQTVSRLDVLVWCLLAVYGPFKLYVGYSLYRLNPKVRTTAITLFVIGSLIPPICFLDWLFLYTLLTRKTRRVLSEDYASIIRATPGIRYRAPMFRRMILMIVILVLGTFLGVLMLRVLPLLSPTRH